MKRALIVAAALVLAAAGAAVAYVLFTKHEGRDIKGSSTVEFVPPPTTTVVEVKPSKPKEPGVVWPTYGYDQARLRAPQAFKLRPPFRVDWTFHAHSLLEFPPAIAYGRVYFVTNGGRVYAVDAKTGKAAWSFNTGRCAAASPAADHRVVFVTFLNNPPCNSSASPDEIDGEIVALSAKKGKVLWRRRMGPSESSPLVANRLVVAGDWRGRMYAFDEATGRVRWSYQTDGRLKGAASLAGRRLYFGSYDGHVYCLDARTGRLIWKASGQARIGGSGTFYSTPAVAYGRVYIGSTDGKVYSFGATSGDLRWSQSTGNYVYASPAVWRERVLIGSYTGVFQSLDAATGEQGWQFQANGPISGSGTVIDGIVYFATLKGRTYGLNARTGRQVWSFDDGKYTPIVADRDRLYLVGYTKLYGLRPR